MAPGDAAGQLVALPSSRLLPAAATTTTSRSVAYLTAVSYCELYGPLRLMLITSAPWSTAQMMPLATVALVPPFVAPSTRTGMICAVLAPAMPRPFPLTAEICPATWVPWPWGSTQPFVPG